MENSCKIAAVGLVGLLHEMNNPLTSIKLSLELLDSPDIEIREIYLCIIQKSVVLIESSIRDICSSFIENELTVQLPSATGLGGAHYNYDF